MTNIYLTPDYTIVMKITDAYNDTSLRDHQSVSPTILQYPFFSATSLSSNSSLIYVYYQVNETFMGEMTYDTAKNAWASEPVHISFLQNGTSTVKLWAVSVTYKTERDLAGLFIESFSVDQPLRPGGLY